MAEGEDEVLYESLDSHSSDEDVDEYITVSTPLPYLCPEVPHKTTPTHIPQPGVWNADYSKPPSPKPVPKLRPPIQIKQEGDPGRKHYRPIPTPPLHPEKAHMPLLPKTLQTSPVSPTQSPASRPVAADYHRIEDDIKHPQKLPKPPRLPKPKLSLKSSKKKMNIHYKPKPEAILPEGVAPTTRQEEAQLQHGQNDDGEDDDVYYDKVLSRTKWRNILKRKKRKMASNQSKQSMVQEKPSKDLSMSTQISGSISKRELEYSDDEMKLRAGNPRVICILLTTIIIALLVAIASLAVALLSISKLKILEDRVSQQCRGNGLASNLNCCTNTNYSSSNWMMVQSLDVGNNISMTVFSTEVSVSMKNAVSWSCDTVTPTSTMNHFIYSSSWINGIEGHNHTCRCTCHGFKTPATRDDLDATKCVVEMTMCT